MYFAKINHQIDINPFDIGREIVFFGSHHPFGLRYSEINSSNNHFLDILPFNYKEHFKLQFLEINIPYVPPHIDNDVITSINFYINAKNYKTSFYKIKNNSPKTTRLVNQTNGCFFNQEHIKYQDSFIANDNDIYILDVTKIHDVRKIDFETNNVRTALVISSSTISFEETLDILRKNNINLS